MCIEPPSLVSPAPDSITCSDSLAVEVVFSRAVDPDVATISALLVEGLDSTPVSTDISSLFTITPSGAAAAVARAGYRQALEKRFQEDLTYAM